MYAKLVFLIAVATVTGAALLGFRQQRIDAGHELTMLQRRSAQMQRELWDLKAQLAEHQTPAQIEAAIGDVRTRPLPNVPQRNRSGPQVVSRWQEVAR